jgi:hypothetical protein
VNIRPLRTLGATLAGIGVVCLTWYAGQDLWHYWQALSAGYTEWATSGQGVWMLTCGVAEAAGIVVLLFVGVRLLGPKFVRSVAAPHLSSPN